MTQKKVSFDEINEIITSYLKERDWNNNSSRSLAISISLEANELLEHYQWGEEPVGSTQEVAEELADIFIYAFQLAQNLEMDIPAEMLNKLDKAKKKYPAKNFRGKKSDEARKNWIKAKLTYEKKGL